MYTNITKLSTTMNEEKWILYQTTNVCNSKIYVGVHKVADTWKSRTYLGSGLTLRLAVRKYGRKNFTRVTLAEFSCAEDAYEAETNTVTEEFVGREDTYNLKIGGRGCRGLVHTPESRARMSVAQKGRVHTDEAKAKMSASGKGKVISEKQKAQIGAAAKGNKYWVGRTHTPEALEKMRNSQLGKTLTPEHKAKISASTMGKAKSPETRAKMKASSKGKIISKEARDNARLANTGANNPKSLAIIIEDTYYETLKIAAQSIGMSANGLKKRVLSTTGNFDNYRFATPEEKAAHSLEASRQST